MGDYLDLVSTSERPMIHDRNLHDSTTSTLEDMYKWHLDNFVKEISFMKGRIVGMLNGNHFVRFDSGINSDQYICDKLGCKYLGVSTFIRLIFHYTKGAGRYDCDIWAHHGVGAGRMIGASLNSIQKMFDSAEADIYLMGHDHKKTVGFVDRLRLGQGGGNIALKNRKILLARTGSFLKGYEPGRRSYIADGAMSPTDLGVIKIELTPKRKNIDKIDEKSLDIHASI